MPKASYLPPDFGGMSFLGVDRGRVAMAWLARPVLDLRLNMIFAALFFRPLASYTNNRKIFEGQ